MLQFVICDESYQIQIPFVNDKLDRIEEPLTLSKDLHDALQGKETGGKGWTRSDRVEGFQGQHKRPPDEKGEALILDFGPCSPEGPS